MDDGTDVKRKCLPCLRLMATRNGGVRSIEADSKEGGLRPNRARSFCGVKRYLPVKVAGKHSQLFRVDRRPSPSQLLEALV
jgi:hypothetical protein